MLLKTPLLTGDNVITDYSGNPRIDEVAREIWELRGELVPLEELLMNTQMKLDEFQARAEGVRQRHAYLLREWGPLVQDFTADVARLGMEAMREMLSEVGAELDHFQSLADEMRGRYEHLSEAWEPLKRKVEALDDERRGLEERVRKLDF